MSEVSQIGWRYRRGRCHCTSRRLRKIASGSQLRAVDSEMRRKALEPQSALGVAERSKIGAAEFANVSLTLCAEITLASDSQFFAGLSADVARGGVFVATYVDIPIGRRVRVELEVLEDHLVIEGTVRWRRQANEASAPGVGISFERLDEKTRSVIEGFCCCRAPLYADEADGA